MDRSGRFLLALSTASLLAIPLATAQEDDFEASFDPVPGNEWWVEVHVDGNEPIVGVDVRVEGGHWQSLTKRDWGAWAKNTHVREGSVVQFRAHSDDGDTVRSDPYFWPDATPAPFTGFFDPVPGNEHWVEVHVKATQPVVGVEARAEGPWHELTKREWGAWAKSFHVPDGSVVEFRVHGDEGGVDLSPRFVWPEATPTRLDVFFDPVPGNQHWVEVHVDGNRPVTAVDARADAGPWHELTKRSWGAWAKSFHVPDGSVVEFRAHSGDGDVDQSEGFYWPDATPTGLDAAFGARAGTEWWVETYVVVDATIATVEGRSNGGPWHAMELKSWGTWAASFHAPPGSLVEFRVTDTSGIPDTSDGFRWPSADAVGADQLWPNEGSFRRYDTWDDPPGGFEEEGHTTSVYHEGTWWNRERFTTDFVHDDEPPEHHTEFSKGGCGTYGPTSGVNVGDNVFITAPCSDAERNATVREQQTDQVHIDGDQESVGVWYATDRDPCNCVEWQVRWDRDFGLVTYQNLAGRGANGAELVDTNAPLV